MNKRYGAGDAKIGSIIGKGSREGKKIKARFLKKVPALNSLKTTLDKRVAARIPIKGLDGRKMFIRKQSASLNTLLQSAGAILMKVATIILHNKCIEQGWKFGKDWALVIHYHDEFQCYARRGLEEQLSKIMKDSIKEAGDFFNLKCPMKGDAKIGKNWAETH